MPELPEVETVRKQLEQEVLGASIIGIEVRDTRCFEIVGNEVVSEVITKIRRMGKYLFVSFESGRGLQIHLKMTGRLIISKQMHKRKNARIGDVEIDYEIAPHTRVVMSLGDGRKVYYWDTRMFGYIKVVEDIENEHQKLKKKLGPEPWDISDSDLLRKFKKTGRAIKEAILDQSMLAGVGNIYANDALWMAGIDPRRKASSMKLSEVKKLRASLCAVLERGLLVGGASDNTYRNFYDGRGGYQDEFLVYGRKGEPCNKCGRSLERIVVGGRGTWMCSECQV